MDNDYDNTDESGGATSWLERMTGRSTGDIRIHDSAQAGELARRLGARAFTVGRDIYVRSELANPETPEGRSLLAHEVTHAMEQTGAPLSDMPLLRPRYAGGASGGHGDSVSVQRTAVGGATPASLPASEVAAESAEASTAQSGRAAQSQSGSSGMGQRQSEPHNTQSAEQQTDPSELAERVYALMVQEMLIDRERAAHL